MSQTYRGLRRQTPLPCCVLTRSDIRTLYARLSEKVIEGLELQLSAAEKPDDLTEDEWEDLKAKAREAAQLTAMIFGASGEQVSTTETEGLLDRNLPDRITSVTLDSAMALKNALNVDARSRFSVTIDFTETPNFANYDPTVRPTPNASLLEVWGPDETWVSGVHELVIQFFKDRSSGRRLIHSSNVFFALHLLFVLPASIWISYRAVELLPPALTGTHPALTAGLYFYCFLVAFVAFRLIKLGVRRSWPYVELERDSRTPGRIAIVTIGGGVLVAFMYDLMKQLFL